MSPPNTTDTSKEKSLAELLILMEEHAPIIPDAVLDHYLTKAGFDCDDVRMYYLIYMDKYNKMIRKRLLGLAAQKFISDIANDSMQYSKIRAQSSSSKEKKNIKEKRNVLMMEDLSNALAEQGVNIKKPEYFLQ